MLPKVSGSLQSGFGLHGKKDFEAGANVSDDEDDVVATRRGRETRDCVNSDVFKGKLGNDKLPWMVACFTDVET